jgi:serine/threonine protein kinase
VSHNAQAENMMLDSEGHIVLIDFGFACKVGTVTGPCGSLPYMAPETLGNPTDSFIKPGTKVTASQAEDWWAFGILAHELLCGKLPWEMREKGLRKEILTTDVAPPRRLSAEASDLITSLTNKDVSARMGCEGTDIRAHPFFK